MATRMKSVALLVVCVAAVLLLPLPVNLIPAVGVVWALIRLRRRG